MLAYFRTFRYHDFLIYAIIITLILLLSVTLAMIMLPDATLLRCRHYDFRHLMMPPTMARSWHDAFERRYALRHYYAAADALRRLRHTPPLRLRDDYQIISPPLLRFSMFFALIMAAMLRDDMSQHKAAINNAAFLYLRCATPLSLPLCRTLLFSLSLLAAFATALLTMPRLLHAFSLFRFMILMPMRVTRFTLMMLFTIFRLRCRLFDDIAARDF